MVVPTRAIYHANEFTQFKASKTYADIVSFVKLLGESVKGVKISDSYVVSSHVAQIVNVLESLQTQVEAFPPIDQPMRFGNKAFRSWLTCVRETSRKLHESLLPSELHHFVPELSPYLTESFGNDTRIDYGTGHEACFVLWLYCLFEIGFLTAADLTAVVLRVFNAYLQLMRQMQLDYMLEPAGSHGVWGLDDYQCLVFFFGASQLRHQQQFPPSAIHDPELLSTNAEEYLYFAAIRFIQQVKTGSPFAETSPMLNDISGVTSWEKVTSGMLKLFEGEVLGKFPVIQHMLFGSLVPCTWTVSVPAPGATALPHPAVHHDVKIHSPNFDLPGATAKAPWVDPDDLQHLPENMTVKQSLSEN